MEGECLEKRPSALKSRRPSFAFFAGKATVQKPPNIFRFLYFCYKMKVTMASYIELILRDRKKTVFCYKRNSSKLCLDIGSYKATNY